MSETPESLKFAKSHEWARELPNQIIEVGISDYAQESLGDVVYVELPGLGDSLTAGEECCAVESVKAASDIYAPLSGEVVAVNEALDDEPELLNQSPYGDGWIFKLKVEDLSELDALLNAAQYAEQTAD